ncbi:hypothetical protein [Streptomyces sp. CBMA156]|uniref:hypothetical protein n=1 Tax=Streptomyces sp. CBMA156 TaxID=1930280 RepID=UPI001661F0B7|nr:hypothetical protein [Streptomyces sp. CBMA156]MBD0673156.1 hypothetical protein [Streptomyces sp. CBMA156]
MLTATDRTVPLSLAAWTWIDSTPDGLVSFMLVTPARADAPGLRRLATRAGLAAPELPLPSPGIRIVLDGPDALVLLPHVGNALRVSADEGWADFARRGGTIVLLMGQRYLDTAARRIDVEEYLQQALPSRQLWLGKTTLAADYTDQQRRAEACIVCGRHEPPLSPAGHAYTSTSGAPLGWAVVAHPSCTAQEA